MLSPVKIRSSKREKGIIVMAKVTHQVKTGLIDYTFAGRMGKPLLSSSTFVFG